MNGGTASAPRTASELWMVKPQIAPTIAASTVMTTMTGSRCRQSARVLSAQTRADRDQRDERGGVLRPQHGAEQRDQDECPCRGTQPDVLTFANPHVSLTC